MKTKNLIQSICLKSILIFMLFCIGGGAAKGDIYKLVTSTDELTDGDTYLIVYNNGESSKCMSSQNDKYRNVIDVVVDVDNAIIENPSTKCSKIIINKTSNGYYSLKDGTQYLNHTGTGNTLTKSDSPVDFEITFSGSSATLKVQNQEYQIQYNSGSPRFSCYKNTQKNPSLFKLQSSNISTPTFSPEVFEFYTSQKVSITADDGCEIYYTTDGSIPSATSTHYSESFDVENTTTIKAIAIKDGKESDIAEATYTKIQTSALKIYWKESFNDMSGTGGNKDGFKGTSTARANLPTNISTYAAYEANKCIKLGSSSKKGYFTFVPEIPTDGNYFLSFKAAPWDGDLSKVDVMVQNVLKETYTLIAGEYITCTISLKNIATTDSIYIQSNSEKNNRFFLDDILIYQDVTDTPDTGNDLYLKGAWNGSEVNTLISNNRSLFLNEMIAADETALVLPETSNCLVFANETQGLTRNEIIDGTCANLTLIDKVSFHTPEAFTATKATYSREAYQDGGWESIILPFAVKGENIPKNYHFEKFSQLNENTVSFVTATSLEANTPYLMRYTGTDAAVGKKGTCTFTASGCNVTRATETEQFKGNYENGISGVDKYILKADGSAFTKGNEGATIPAFRAYLEVGSSAQSAPALRVVHQGQTVTSVTPIPSNELLRIGCDGHQIRIDSPESKTIAIYNIMGILVRNVKLHSGQNIIEGLSSGFYTIAGKKVIIK